MKEEQEAYRGRERNSAADKQRKPKTSTIRHFVTSTDTAGNWNKADRMEKDLPFFLCFVFCTCASFTVVHSLPIDEESLNALPQAIRQSPSPLVQVLNSTGITSSDTSVNVTNTSLSDIENDNLTHSLQLQYRERKKQERIFVIQAQILHSLRMDRQPNISSSVLSDEERRKFTMIFERMQNGNNGHLEMSAQGISNSFLSKLQSFYPSCSFPNNTDRNIWEAANTFRIFYDTPISRQSATSEVTIMLAKLRLYKMIGNADPNFIGWNPDEENMPRYNQLETLINNRAANSINVFIYQFMKPLRANKREKKRLVDTRTIPIDYKGWVEFNVFDSLNYWLHHSNKNFGFDVQVEDAYGNKLNPILYFHSINCSSDAPQDPPFPNIIELHPEMGENESSLFDNETYPTLDLQTAEVPRDFSELDALAERMNDRTLRKRSTRHHSENSCRGEEEYVTFAEMGLDNYILWPSGVLWTFCEGSCHSEYTPYKRWESFYAEWMKKLFGIRTDEPHSSCGVTSRESMTIIVNEDESEICIEDIVPTSCGCWST